MGKGKHKTPTGKKNRETHVSKFPPKLGYYLIVTDTEATERCYFEGIRDNLPDNIKKQRNLVINVQDCRTVDLIVKCKQLYEYDPQYRIPWIVFDRDQVPDFDKIIEKAEKEGINVGWSNPCFEIWLYTYYGSMPVITESKQCCSSFGNLYLRETGVAYDKADNDMYKNILKTGDESKAITIAERKYAQQLRSGKQKPSEMCPCTTVHNLIRDIRDKVSEA